MGVLLLSREMAVNEALPCDQNHFLVGISNYESLIPCLFDMLLSELHICLSLDQSYDTFFQAQSFRMVSNMFVDISRLYMTLTLKMMAIFLIQIKYFFM